MLRVNALRLTQRAVRRCPRPTTAYSAGANRTSERDRALGLSNRFLPAATTTFELPLASSPLQQLVT